MDSTFIRERIESIKKRIVAFEDALFAFASNGTIKSYRLDTGQSVQQVTREDLESINNQLDQLYNQLAMFQKRLYGDSLQARPDW